MEQSMHDKIDALELAMRDYSPADCPLTHTFSPGLYLRTIYMGKGTLITSLIHKTEHQFIVSMGSALVKVNEEEWVRVQAPFIGKTYPGTRRILLIEENCVWTTCHATDIQPTDESEEAIAMAVQKIEDLIIEPHVNKLLGGVVKNNIINHLID